MKRFDGKVVIVTGGGSGIGRATCERFASEGAAVAIAEINAETGRGAAEEIQRQGGRALFVRTDVADEQSVKAAVAEPPADRRVTLSLRGGFTRPAFPRGAGTVRLYEMAEKIADRIEQPIFEVQSRGGSDGSFAAALGVPTLDGLGPIAHETVSRGEWVEVDSIAGRGALFAALVAGLAARPEALRG
jgi:hypothetical protein